MNRPLPKKLAEEYKEFTTLERSRNLYKYEDGHRLFVGISYVVSEEEYVIYCSMHQWSIEYAWEAYSRALGVAFFSKYPPFEIAIFDDESAQPLWSTLEDEDDSIRSKTRMLSQEEFNELTKDRTETWGQICGLWYEAEYDDNILCWYAPPIEHYNVPSCLEYAPYPRSFYVSRRDVEERDVMGEHNGRNE